MNAAGRAGDRDHRLPVLLALGLLICLVQVIGQFEEWSEETMAAPAEAPPRFLWVQSGSLPAGPCFCENNSLPAKSGRKITPLESNPDFTPFFFKPIPINRAGLATLTTIPGIGPGRAGRIIALRARKSGHLQPADLLLIKGIGPGTLKRLLPRISFE